MERDRHRYITTSCVSIQVHVSWVRNTYNKVLWWPAIGRRESASKLLEDSETAMFYQGAKFVDGRPR
jgi:hypothetical protein